MNGLIAQSIQHFLATQYGPELWVHVAKHIRAPKDGFEAMRTYPTEMFVNSVKEASVQLNRKSAEIWEDLGTHIVTHPEMSTARRLLRFGGASFEEFLWSLDVLRERSQLALPGFEFPDLQLSYVGDGGYQLAVSWPVFGDMGLCISGPLILGVLRALADDYGALVYLDLADIEPYDTKAIVTISLLEQSFAVGKVFHLSSTNEAQVPTNSKPTHDNRRPISCDQRNLRLEQDTLNRLMPMHMQVSSEGVIKYIGPTLFKITGSILNRRVFDVIHLHRPQVEFSLHNFSDLIGQNLHVHIIGSKGAHESLQAMIEPLNDDGWIMYFSLGYKILDHVTRHGLTANDFAPGDPTVEMLFIVEAHTSVLSESARLNSKLDAAREKAQAQAETDKLTGLYNRRAFERILQGLFLEYPEKPFGLMNIDLDFFKEVNDVNGHAAGDHVLQNVAQILREKVRQGDAVARVGGDEFMIAFPDCADVGILHSIAQRIIAAVEQPIRYNHTHCNISASIGMTHSDLYDRLDPTEMLHDADEALYSSKRAGRSCYRLHKPKEQQMSLAR